MRIISYEYSERSPSVWSFNRVELGNINLLVGDTGSGKTRFLNTISNLGFTVSGTRPLPGPLSNLGLMVSGTFPLPGPCQWKLRFHHQDLIYEWHIRTNKLPDGRTVVTQEHLSELTKTSPKTIVSRSQSSFRFLSQTLPKLRSDSLSVTLLKEEPTMRPLFEAFSLIIRRNFFADELKAVSPVTITQPNFFDTPPKSPNDISIMGLPINPKLYLLFRYFPVVYGQICEYFTSVFPSVTAIAIKDLKDFVRGFIPPGPTPVFSVKERNIRTWISIDQLSTGMQKVLLVLTDVFTLPDGSIYMIDEYENSLGVTAIDFLPSFLANSEKDIQFIITSHHPYLINSIPAQNWLVFHRKGGRVKIRYGADNIGAYGESKQQRFIRLLNDPFYTDGVD